MPDPHATGSPVAILVVKHVYMDKPVEQRLMHAAYFKNGGDGFDDPHCVHAVTLADVCPECDEATDD